VKLTSSGGALTAVNKAGKLFEEVNGGNYNDPVSTIQKQRVAVDGHYVQHQPQLQPAPPPVTAVSLSQRDKESPSSALKDIIKVKVHNRDDAVAPPHKKTPTPSKGIYSSDTHFSGSAYMSSPDPSTIPLPVFDCGQSERGVEINYYKDTAASPASAVGDQMRRTRKPTFSAKKNGPAAVDSGTSVPVSYLAAVQIKSPTSSHKDSSIATAASASSTEENDKSSVLKRFLKIRQM